MKAKINYRDGLKCTTKYGISKGKMGRGRKVTTEIADTCLNCTYKECIGYCDKMKNRNFKHSIDLGFKM